MREDRSPRKKLATCTCTYKKFGLDAYKHSYYYIFYLVCNVWEDHRAPYCTCLANESYLHCHRHQSRRLLPSSFSPSLSLQLLSVLWESLCQTPSCSLSRSLGALSLQDLEDRRGNLEGGERANPYQHMSYTSHIPMYIIARKLSEHGYTLHAVVETLKIPSMSIFCKLCK